MGAIRFLIGGVDPGIAQFGVGEGDQLPGVTRVGHDLLIAGHAGVEHHFSDGRAPGPEGLTAQHGAVGQHQQGSGSGLAHGFRAVDSIILQRGLAGQRAAAQELASQLRWQWPAGPNSGQRLPSRSNQRPTAPAPC